MRHTVLPLLLGLLLLPGKAFADDSISPENANWKSNYDKGRSAMHTSNLADAALYLNKAKEEASHFKPEDPRFFIVMSELMSIDVKQKDNVKYESDLKEARERYVKAFGPEYYEVGVLDFAHGTLFDRSGRLEEAEKAYKGGIAIVEKAFGPNFIKLAAMYHALARFDGEVGKHSDALKNIQREYEILQQNPPVDNHNLSGCLLMQGYIYEALNRPADAQATWKKYHDLEARHGDGSNSDGTPANAQNAK